MASARAGRFNIGLLIAVTLSLGFWVLIVVAVTWLK